MFFKKIHIRIKIVMFVLFLFLILIIGKVFYIQVFSYSKLYNYANSLWSRNLPIWMTYEPGSTFKIITSASSLEENIVDLENEHFYDGGAVTVSGATLHCWKHGGHGEQTYLQVVENSCNSGFVNLGLRLGKEKLFDYINKCGFGEKTGVDLNGEVNRKLFNVDKIGDLELATTAFGVSAY